MILHTGANQCQNYSGNATYQANRVLMVIVIPDMELTILGISYNSIKDTHYIPLISVHSILGKP